MAGWLVKHWSVSDTTLEKHYAVDAADQRAALRMAHEALSPDADARLTGERPLTAAEEARLAASGKPVMALDA